MLCIKLMKKKQKDCIYLIEHRFYKQRAFLHIYTTDELSILLDLYDDFVSKYGRKFYDVVLKRMKQIFKSYGCEVYVVLDYAKTLSVLAGTPSKQKKFEKKNSDLNYDKLEFSYIKIVAPTTAHHGGDDDVIVDDVDATGKLQEDVEIGLLFNWIFLDSNNLEHEKHWNTPLIPFDDALLLKSQFCKNYLSNEVDIANFVTCYKNGNKEFMDALKDVLSSLLVNYVKLIPRDNP